MLADNKQIDKRIIIRNKDRSAAFGRPTMKLLGGGALTSLRSTNPTNLFWKGAYRNRNFMVTVQKFRKIVSRTDF